MTMRRVLIGEGTEGAGGGRLVEGPARTCMAVALLGLSLSTRAWCRAQGRRMCSSENAFDAFPGALAGQDICSNLAVKTTTAPSLVRVDARAEPDVSNVQRRQPLLNISSEDGIQEGRLSHGDAVYSTLFCSCDDSRRSYFVLPLV